MLSKLCFPKAKSQYDQAGFLANQLVGRGLVKQVKLDGYGSILVLTRYGENLLEQNNIRVINKGREIGRTVKCPDEKDRYRLPITFGHTQLAATALCCLSEQGWTVFSERQLRQTLALGDKVDRDDKTRKIPDGMAISPEGQTLFVEVEHSRKTSDDLNHLVDSLLSPNDFFDVSYHLSQLMPFWSEHQYIEEAVGTLIIFDPNSVSSDGRQLNHRRTIWNKVQSKLVNTFSASKICFASATVCAKNAVDITLEPAQLLVGENMRAFHSHYIPNFETLSAESTHFIDIHDDRVAELSIKLTTFKSGRSCYQFNIAGMVPSKFDHHRKARFRGNFLTPEEAFWFGLCTIYHGETYDIKAPSMTVEDYLYQH